MSAQSHVALIMKLSRQKPVAFGSLNEAEFNDEIEKGFADMAAGRMRPAADVFDDLQRDYGEMLVDIP